MRSWKFLMVALALLAGAAGLNVPAKAAPLAVPIAAAQSDAEPLVQTARWHGRRHWHRHHGWRRHYGWRRHHGWHRHHHWGRHWGRYGHRHHGWNHRRLRFY